MAEWNQPLESYTDDPYFILNPSREDMRQADRNASLNDITTYIYQSLIDYQGKWIASDRSEWIIYMPNARYLAVGDKIRNTTTAETYTIDTVIDEPTGLISISGPTAPQTDDVLELEEENMVNFVSDYSQEYKDKPRNEWVDTISYRLKRKEPGTISKHPFDPPTEIKPRIRQYLVDPDHLDSHILVMGQWFDNLIQFDCWTKTNNRGDDLIEWFEDFMYKYTWVWKKNGVNEILYWMRTIDEEVRKWRNDLSVRSVIYYFRTEKIVTIREHDLKQIDLYLEVSNAVPSGFIGVGYGAIPPSGRTEILDHGFTV
jgi:hypothetical protein